MYIELLLITIERAYVYTVHQLTYSRKLCIDNQSKLMILTRSYNYDYVIGKSSLLAILNIIAMQIFILYP